MKRKYIVPQLKMLGIEEESIMANTRFDKDMGQQSVIPTEDEEYDGEFGTNETFWAEVDHYLIYDE